MKIVELSVRRRVTVAMFTIAVLLFGLVSFDRLKVNLLPDLSYPTLTIRTEYRGAAPAEVENLISKPIEEALGIVKNVQQVRSVSRSGQSDVLLEFAWGTEMDFGNRPKKNVEKGSEGFMYTIVKIFQTFEVVE